MMTARVTAISGAETIVKTNIVRSIAHEWGVTEDRTGNVVWATLGGPSRRRAT